MAAAEILAPADVVLHRPARLVRVQPVQRRAVGTESAGAGRDQHRAGFDPLAAVGLQGKPAGLAGERLDTATEQAAGCERGDLCFQLRNQYARLDRRVGRDVENWFFGVQRRALAAHLVQRVDQYTGQFQHAALEGGEQAHRARTDDSDVGLDHGGYVSSDRNFGSLARRIG